MSRKEILSALERDESIRISDVANALIKRWPAGIIVIALEPDMPSATTAMSYSWRGAYHTILGMVTKLQHVMVCEGTDEDPAG